MVSELRTGTCMLGRGEERALLDGLVQDIRRGKSQSLVLRGEAGIGKTALLEYLVRSASGLTVLRSAGVESDMELAFGGLHQLCAPLLGRVGRLPDQQRQAIETVFGLSSGPAPDRFLVGLATLSLLSDAAEETPMLCVIDDAQWLDQASALTLAFVAGRLLAEPIGIVFAAREPGAELQHLPEQEIRGLRNGEARELLSSSITLKLDERVRDRFIAETRGNPLALLELPRGLTPVQLAGGFGVLEPRALHTQIEDSFARRVQELSDDTRSLLLLAAADPVGDPQLLWRAAEGLAICQEAAEEARGQGLMTVEKTVVFRHPLVRSAIYRSATAEDRRAAHNALAEATDAEADPDRRAWHHAAATSGPDEKVAQELERSAGRAQSRGGAAAAAAFLRRAVALTADPERRAERAIAAAQACLQAGAFGEAQELLTTAEAGVLDEFQRARVDFVRAHIAFAAGLGSEAPPLLLLAARRLEPFDLELARETYLNGWGAAGMTHPAAAVRVLDEICAAALALPPPDDAEDPLGLVLEGLALLTAVGPAAGAPKLLAAGKALPHVSGENTLRWGWAAASAYTACWDLDGLLAMAQRQIQLARETGALSLLPLYLSQLGIALPWMGDFAGTFSAITETSDAARATGSPLGPYTLLTLRALQGREAEVSAVIANAVERTGEGQWLVAGWAQWASAILYNGLGHYEAAAAAAQQVLSNAVHAWPAMWALPELVEAAARTGDMNQAREAVERLAETTRPFGTDWALGIEARSRAQTSAGDTAEELYQQAISLLGRTRLRTELARAHLLYGEWLRRENRRMDARAQLRDAYDQLSSIGMEAFAERARKELLATGETARKRTVETRDDLTPQEQLIARLAREGLSNPEIGARLFISARTAEWHLRNVFTKLGISSRQELRAMPEDGSAG